MKKVLVILCGFLVCFGALGGCKDENNIVERDVEEIVQLENWFFSSGIPNYIIRFIYNNENTVFHCCVERGAFWVKDSQKYEKETTINAGDCLYWNPIALNSDVKEIYVDIIMKENENFVGYVIIKIEKIDETGDYRAEVVKSTVFPKIEGKYQPITEAQVRKKIKKIKNK